MTDHGKAVVKKRSAQQQHQQGSAKLPTSKYSCLTCGIPNTKTLQQQPIDYSNKKSSRADVQCVETHNSVNHASNQKVTSGVVVAGGRRRESVLDKITRNLWKEIGVAVQLNGETVKVEYTTSPSQLSKHHSSACARHQQPVTKSNGSSMQTRRRSSKFCYHDNNNAVASDTDSGTYDATISDHVSGRVPKLTLRKRDGTFSPIKEMNGKKRLKLVVGNKSVVRIDLTK